MGSGAILNEVRSAGKLLAESFGIESDIWSVTSFNELARDGQRVSRWNMLNPDKQEKTAYVTDCLKGRKGPVVASSDYIRLYGEQIRAFVPSDYTVLGTDGFGRSDTREKLRQFFEVDRYHIVVATLSALERQGEVERKTVLSAMRKFNIDRNSPSPMLR